MKNIHIFSAFGVAALVAGSASAQTVGIGTTKGGATAQVAAAISKIVSSHAGGLQMRTQVMGGTQKYIPVVNAGKLEFGVSNMMQYYMAKKGTGLSKGHKHDNLRLLATMMTFRIGWLVPRNSDIKSIADFKGKRVPHGFKGAPLFHFLLSAGLANGGLSYDDVQKNPGGRIAPALEHVQAGQAGCCLGRHRQRPREGYERENVYHGAYLAHHLECRRPTHARVDSGYSSQRLLG